ncbi:hypothetical protein [Nocardia spumae]|uniref:hypothetical protein n=1 Tax=Nocardia spumae TaxID=2887190 RepID=UPI001D1489AC|nr:hypothetical protein [Nocardia spumae]
MAYPYSQPGYVPVAPKPGGGTAITAGVLALLQGIGLTVFSIGGAVSTRHDRQGGSDTAADMIALVLFGSLSALFLAGAILLLCRRMAGRVIVILLTALVLLVVPAIAVIATIVGGIGEDDVAPFAVMLGILFAIELPILVCASMSSTGRWINTRTAANHRSAYPYY